MKFVPALKYIYIFKRVFMKINGGDFVSGKYEEDRGKHI